MAVDERSRHELYVWLEEAAGRERADTLMSLLPPVGWADVATKADLDHLRVAVKGDVDRLRIDVDHLRIEVRSDLESLGNRLFATFRGEMSQQTRTFLFAVVTVMITLVSLTYAAARLG